MNLIREDVMVAYADGELAAEDCRKLERLLDIDPESRSVLLGLRLAALYAKEAINGLEFEDGSPSHSAARTDLLQRWSQGASSNAKEQQAQARRLKRKINTP